MGTFFTKDVMAAAMGCSLWDSAEPTTAKRRCKGMNDCDTRQLIFAMRGLPSVTVPVLSNTTVVTYTAGGK